VVQLEARHNLFFVKWTGYTRAKRGWLASVPLPLPPNAWPRWPSGPGDDGGARPVGIDLWQPDFVALCIAENVGPHGESQASAGRPGSFCARLVGFDAQVAMTSLRPRPIGTTCRENHPLKCGT
jgi:hypothetical protein